MFVSRYYVENTKITPSTRLDILLNWQIEQSGKSRWFCSKFNGFTNSNENVPHRYVTISSVVLLYYMPYIFLLNKVELKNVCFQILRRKH
jgi:hypothetical protein